MAIVVDEQIEGVLKGKRQKKLLKNGTYRLYDLFVVLFAAKTKKQKQEFTLPLPCLSLIPGRWICP